MTGMILLLISVALVNNVVLSQFLGLCPFLGVSKKIETAAGMGGAVIFVMSIASIATSLVYKILVLFHLEYLNTVTFILVIAALVQLVEMFLKKYSSGLYSSLGVYLPLITTNCAVLGVAITNVQNNYDILFVVLEQLLDLRLPSLLWLGYVKKSLIMIFLFHSKVPPLY